MRIRAVTALLGFAVLLVPRGAPAFGDEAQARADRVILVVLDRVLVDDLLAIPSVRALEGRAAFGLMSTAGRGVITPFVGALSISAGARAVAPDPNAFFLTVTPGPVTERLAVGTVADAYVARTGRLPPASTREGIPFVYPDIELVLRANARADVRATPGLLGSALRDAGLRASVASLDGYRSRLAPLVAMDEEGVVDAGFIMAPARPRSIGRALDRALASGDLVTVDGGEGTDARAILPEVLARVRPGDALVVMGADPPEDTLREHTWLSPVLAMGGGLEPGTLTSPSTRRDGVVSNVDVLPTVLAWLGVDVPDGLVGQRFETRANAEPLAATSESFHAYERLARHRGEAFRLVIVFAIVAMAAAAVTGLRRREPGARLPGWVRTGLFAAAAVPLVMLLEPLVAFESLSATLATIVGGSLAVGVAFAALVRRDFAGFAVLGGASLVILLADVLVGSPLGARSLLGFTVAGGTRFYGLASEEMGVALGGLLLVLGHVRDARPGLRRVAYAGAVVSVMVLAAPPFGAKFGMLLTAVPALAVAWTIFEGRRMTRETVLLVAAVLIAGVGLATAAGLLAGAEGSHIGLETRAVGESGAGALLSVLLRRAGVALRLLFTFWSWLVLAGVGVAVFVGVLRRRAPAGSNVRPGVRGAAVGALAAGVTGLLFNDAGAVIVATLVLVVAPAIMAEAAAAAQAGRSVRTRRRSSTSATRSPSAIGAIT
ncbi:MAG: hypothetical protein WD770_10810 [Actinomycetota bacterium]